ncbi:carbon-nitrogen hydrolase family protein [Streptomyces sp. NPDC048389]|uniref:carbon-nitrogen hydrolase family protein n=1 Tax=Streptomyces sp. NPDC048389 TaxID=3154622 RepID=UPI003453413F
MKIAAGQFTSAPGDIGANVHSMRGLVREAAGQGARLVAFCELAATGYDLGAIAGDPGLWLTEDDPRLDPVREACRTTSTAALVGCAARTSGPRPTISALVIGPDGGLLARYDKRHLHGREQEVFAAGAEDGRFTLDGVRFAVAVCYDNRFPEVAERAAGDGCQVYVAGSVLEEGNDSFEAVYPVRARANGLPVLLANAVGPCAVGDCRGGSAVWGPDGALLATAGTAAPGLAVARVATDCPPDARRTGRGAGVGA